MCMVSAECAGINKGAFYRAFLCGGWVTNVIKGYADVGCGRNNECAGLSNVIRVILRTV